MASAGAGFVFSIVLRLAWAEVQILELRHVKPLASVPRGFLADVMEDYNCWGGDLAEVVIHANHPRDERRKDIAVATCRAACLSNIGCQAWSLNHGSHGARGSGHCWLKHSCINGDADPYSVSGLVDHAKLVQHVQAPDNVDPADLVGVLEDTNCWGRDLAEVAINSTGNTTRDELIVACKDACVADRACAAWTLNHGRTGIQGQGHCWLKNSCAGRMYDARAEAGTVTHSPNNMALTMTQTLNNTVSHQALANHSNAIETRTGVAGGGNKSNTSGGADDGAQGGTSSTTTGTGDDSGNSAEGSSTKKASEMRFLEHGDPAASAPILGGGDGKHSGLTNKDKGIIGGVVGASTGALALGLLAGLLHPTSPQPSRGLVQPSPTFAAVGGLIAANDTNGTIHEEEESPVKQWWGWIFLIPLFLMVALFVFAVFMFRGNGTGAWSKRKRARAYSRVGSETSTDTAEGMMSSDSPSPRSPVHMCPRNQLVYNSPTPAQRAFFRSPRNPQTRDISVPMAHSPGAQIRHLSPVPMAQAGVMVMVPTSPRQLPSQQQQQMLVVASQQQSQVQGQLSPSNRQTGGNNSLFDALDQNQDGVITRSEFNRAFGVSPLLMGSAATTPVSAVITSSPRALVGSPSMTLATPGVQPGTVEVMSPSRVLSQSASSVQAVMGSPVLMAVPASPLPGAQVDRASAMATPLLEIHP